MYGDVFACFMGLSAFRSRLGCFSLLLHTTTSLYVPAAFCWPENCILQRNGLKPYATTPHRSLACGAGDLRYVFAGNRYGNRRVSHRGIILACIRSADGERFTFCSGSRHDYVFSQAGYRLQCARKTKSTHQREGARKFIILVFSFAAL